MPGDQGRGQPRRRCPGRRGALRRRFGRHDRQPAVGGAAQQPRLRRVDVERGTRERLAVPRPQGQFGRQRHPRSAVDVQREHRPGLRRLPRLIARTGCAAVHGTAP
ncbi:hypothetical protein SBRY_100138 [Actinacidiphila bryophytorum]|uniref:Uncharacterized protein n=1 Tax=Actinacidiphila bryophytorum TaxID=1436133 RepID=A0A9W4E445_9ACTN|nr:hypothetical protein SBRY_100138 [Actinacidiphila bryophytorum]